MSDADPSEFALIILGNSGVGKSFLANILLDRSCFEHQFAARSVTHRAESALCRLAGRSCRVYNIPGLIEGDVERVDLNRREIQRAFEEQKGYPAVIMYVFGHQNGRLRNEDITTFRMIHQVYRFSSDSLLLVVNGLPPDRPTTYNEDTRTTLIDLVGIKPRQIWFIDHLNSAAEEQQDVRADLIERILSVRPQTCDSVNEIRLFNDDVHQLAGDLNRIRIQINSEQEVHEDTVKQMDRDYQAAQRIADLRRFFCQAKVHLRQLLALAEREAHLTNMSDQWQAEEIGYKDDRNSRHYQLAVRSKREAQNELTENASKQRRTVVALDQYRRDIEQACYELEQIYDGQLDAQFGPVREYLTLFDDLRFDPSISNAKNDFLNDLSVFTLLHFRDVE